MTLQGNLHPSRVVVQQERKRDAGYGISARTW